MTNQTIPPCPVCGTVPEKHLFFNNAIHPKCKHLLYSREKSKHKYGELYITVERWRIRCTRALGRACRELGIETVEQLKARLAPDPRVAVLEIALTKVAESDLSQVPYSQIKAHIEEALFRSQFIAAQRGEVDG